MKQAKTAIGRMIKSLPGDLDLDSNDLAEQNSFSEAFSSDTDTAIYTLPSGKKIRFVPKTVDPNACCIWNENNRLSEYVDDNSTKDLLDKIKAQGQLVPALVRPCKDKDYRYEIIYGRRRHFVCSKLGIKFKVFEADIDDADALLFMDAENEGRQDTSPFEKATSYKAWLENGKFKDKTHLANSMGVDRAWIHNILNLTELPAEIISAFKNPNKLHVKWGMEIRKLLKSDNETKKRIINEASLLSKKDITPEEVYKHLIAIGKHSPKKATSKKQKTKETYANVQGDYLFCVEKSANTTKLQFDKRVTENDIDKCVKLVKDILEAKIQKV